MGRRSGGQCVNTLILLRHGETQFHAEGRYQGHSQESRLSALGSLQTEELRTSLAGIRVGSCFASTLVRVREMLSLLSPTVVGMRVMFDPNLAEIAIVGWEGRLKSEIQRTDPNGLLLWQCAPHLYV